MLRYDGFVRQDFVGGDDREMTIFYGNIVDLLSVVPAMYEDESTV